MCMRALWRWKPTSLILAVVATALLRCVRNKLFARGHRVTCTCVVDGARTSKCTPTCPPGVLTLLFPHPFITILVGKLVGKLECRLTPKRVHVRIPKEGGHPALAAAPACAFTTTRCAAISARVPAATSLNSKEQTHEESNCADYSTNDKQYNVSIVIA